MRFIAIKTTEGYTVNINIAHIVTLYVNPAIGYTEIYMSTGIIYTTADDLPTIFARINPL